MRLSALRFRAFLATPATGPRRLRKRARMVLERLEDRRLMATFSVINANDSGAGSLRQAILDANAAGGADRIEFNLPANALTIAPTTELPAITEGVAVDATTQPGFAGTPLVQLSGSGMGVGKVGLRITGGSSSVRGLLINRFRAASNGSFSSFGEGGFAIELAGLGGNVIAGNVIGSDAEGTVSRGNSAGIHVLNSPANTIGGTIAADRNLISGNFVDGAGVPLGFGAGIVLDSASSSGNVILGNYLGTNAAGTAPLGNGSGVIVSGAPNNLIGGAAANVISGNTPFGVWLRQNASGNRVEGNFLGTNPTGTAPVTRTVTTPGVATNQVDVLLTEGATANTIGGTTAAARNVIAAQNVGVGLSGGSVTNNLVVGNFIGVNAAGTTALLPTNATGLGLLLSSPANTIGGTVAGASNVIGGLGGGLSAGRSISASGLIVTSGPPADLQGSVVTGNLFGVDAGGVNPLPLASGIAILDDASGLLIGGNAPAAGNVIANIQTFAVNVENGRLITIRANSIYDTGSGIVLNEANDANDGIAAPTLLTLVDATGNSKTVTGQFNGAANQTYIVDFYASQDATLGGPSQGETLIASGPVTTNAQGLGTFSLPLPFPAGQPYASATITDPLGNTSEFSNTLPVPPAQADLAVAVGPPVGSGDGPVGVALAYSFTVTNNGPNPAPNVRFTHVLPASFGYQSVVPSAGTASFDAASMTITASLGTLAAGSTAVVVITATPTLVGAFPGVGSAVADAVDPNPANGSVSRTFTITTNTTDLLRLSQTASPSPVVVGGVLTYTVTVTNSGTSAAQDVRVVDTLPLGLIFDGASASQGQTAFGASTVTAIFGTLPAGGTATLTIMVRPTAPGLLVNVATVTTTSFEGDPSNNTSTLSTVVERDGPRVTSLQRLGFHSRSTRLVLTFNQALDPARAQNLANYTLQALAPSGQGFKPIARFKIRSAVYDPVLNTVTLTTVKTLPLRRAFRLTALGASTSGITGADGIPLDGAGNSSRGTNYVATLLGYNVIDIRTPATPASLATPRAIRRR